ncbi:hypothetical protein FACS189411_09860 [Bacteroidia bacterium]|nr:hypothetical protein FACS189411_09860 [Bacteroidia bacterium]
MKKIIFIFTFYLLASTANSQDTILVVNEKRIEIKDNGDRLKIKVYEVTDNNETIDDELIFEGHYKDGKSYESRKYISSINIPNPTWKKKASKERDFNDHWAGFGMGFANFADKRMEHFNDIDGVSLRSGKSLEYNLNVLEKSFLLSSRSNWAIVTGMGIRWSRYSLDGNEYFKEVDGITALQPAPEGMNYKSSKLNITSLTIPVLLEWQNRSNLFLSAGVVGVIKTASSSKVSYKDASTKKHTDKMDSGMNLRPVTMEFLVQAGYDWIGVYAKYSPMSIFESGKGPKVFPVSIGLQLHI